MRIRALLPGILFTALTVAPAFGQALAEGAMLHANAAAATAKAGTALGDSLNRATSNNADRLHSITQGAPGTSSGGQIQTVPRAANSAPAAARTSNASTSAGNSSSGGLQITSIRGGNSAVKTGCSTPASKSTSTTANSSPGNAATQPCAAPATTQPTKSVVHINFPQ